MKNFWPIMAICATLLTACDKKETEEMVNAPKAAKVSHTVTVNGVTLTDNYAWMRDPKWPDAVSDDLILLHLQSENEYSDHFFKPLEAKQQQLFEEIKSRIKLTDSSEPTYRDDYIYYSRTEENSDYPIYCRKLGEAAPEEILLDVNKLAHGKKYTELGSIATSPDHKLLAYTVDFSGDENYMLRVLDLATGQYHDDRVTNISEEFVWHQQGNGIFYLPRNGASRNDKVMYHKLGSAETTDDVQVLKEDNPLFQLTISLSRSKAYLIINSRGSGSSESHVVHMDSTDATLIPQLMKARTDKVFYDIQHNGDYFYMHSNDTGGKYHISRMAVSRLGYDDTWNEYIPMDNDRFLESFDITANYLILNYRVQATPLIKILHLKDGIAKIVNFPDEAFVASSYTTNYMADDLRIAYSSMAQPAIIYNYDFDRNKLLTLKEQEVQGDYDPSAYSVKRLWADNDGVKIPISLVYKKSLFKNDGSNPLYLYGYGSYGINIEPRFASSYVSLLDRGFVFAIAHVRGGSYLGQEWYEDGKMLNKKHSFEDFIAASEYLIKEKYTSAKKIVIMGGSAGGLLVGATLNLRPDLFKAAVAHVPFVDVLNTMLDDSLPLTPGEQKEWGNPHDPEYFEYIRSYSPYDNITSQEYPAILATTGVADIRVGYWEAAKWVAKLRELKTDKNKILLRTNLEAGHGGASGRFETMKERAEEFVFILKTFGIED